MRIEDITGTIKRGIIVVISIATLLLFLWFLKTTMRDPEEAVEDKYVESMFDMMEEVNNRDY